MLLWLPILTSSSVVSSNESNSNSELCETTQTRPSLLDRLKCPKASELMRKRKVKTNTPPVGVKRSSGQSSKSLGYTPKSVTPSQRVREFPDERFSVSAGRLFCNACREELGLKTTVILNNSFGSNQDLALQDYNVYRVFSHAPI